MEEVVSSDCPSYSNAGTSRHWFPSQPSHRIILFSRHYSARNCHFCLMWWERREEAVQLFQSLSVCMQWGLMFLSSSERWTTHQFISPCYICFAIHQLPARCSDYSSQIHPREGTDLRVTHSPCTIMQSHWDYPCRARASCQELLITRRALSSELLWALNHCWAEATASS